MRLVLGAPVDVGDVDLFDLCALPDGRAVAVVKSLTGPFTLLVTDGVDCTRSVIDATLVDGADPFSGPYQRTLLARTGAGFALLSATGFAHWSGVGARPTRGPLPAPFPRNAHGFAVELARGASSEDPGSALVLLREPQITDAVTRYALLRLDGGARWDWLGDSGEPPTLEQAQLPTAAAPPILFHGDWRDGRLRLFTVGDVGNFERWGCAFCVDCGVTPPSSASPVAANMLGTYSASGRWLVLNPLRAKGASSLIERASGTTFAPTLPRGHGKLRIADHGGDVFWLHTPRGEPLRLFAARVA